MAPDIAHLPPAGRRPLEGRRILVVEDEALIAMMIEDALSHAGCADVIVAGDGRTALDAVMPAGPAAGAAPACPIDAAVIDLGLPDINGGEVIARLRALWPSLPVLVETGTAPCGDGESRPADGFGLDTRGPTAVLAKPFASEALVRAVASLIAEGERIRSGAPAAPRPPAATSPQRSRPSSGAPRWRPGCLSGGGWRPRGGSTGARCLASPSRTGATTRPGTTGTRDTRRALWHPRRPAHRSKGTRRLA
jgi:CheY-like chemotaxis protein